ncbi:hypothetical protein [Azospirillum endophyticum]
MWTVHDVDENRSWWAVAAQASARFFIKRGHRTILEKFRQTSYFAESALHKI